MNIKSVAYKFSQKTLLQISGVDNVVHEFRKALTHLTNMATNEESNFSVKFVIFQEEKTSDNKNLEEAYDILKKLHVGQVLFNEHLIFHDVNSKDSISDVNQIYEWSQLDFNPVSLIPYSERSNYQSFRDLTENHNFMQNCLIAVLIVCGPLACYGIWRFFEDFVAKNEDGYGATLFADKNSEPNETAYLSDRTFFRNLFSPKIMDENDVDAYPRLEL